MKKDQPIYTYWLKACKIPFGKWMYNLAMNTFIPYTGSIKAKVTHIEPGYATIELKERRAVRNHLKSIHAIALTNLGEYTGNLALFAGLPGDARLIVKSISTTFLKKARGTVTGYSRAPILATNEKTELEIFVEIKDETNEIVATCTIQTLVGPIK